MGNMAASQAVRDGQTDEEGDKLTSGKVGKLDPVESLLCAV